MITDGWVVQRRDGVTTLLRIFDGHVFDMQPTPEVEKLPTGEYDFDFKLVKAIDYEAAE